MTPRARPAPARVPTARPRLERLEPREVPAVVGGLDPSFGTGGKVGPMFGNNFFLYDTVVDSVGRTVAVGNTDAPGTPGGSDFLVVRFNPDGSLDNTFGTGGKQVIDILDLDGVTHGSDVATGVAVDANDNVIAVGNSVGKTSTDMVFVRLLAGNGALDPTLGGDGTRHIHLGATAIVNGNDVTVDAAGNILGVGTGQLTPASPPQIEVVRMLPDGTLDNTFAGGGGFESIPDPGNLDTGQGIALDGGGNIVLAGYGAPAGGGASHMVAVRLLPDGTIDPGFNGGAIQKSTFVLGTAERAFEVAVDAANHVFLAGDNFSGGGAVRQMEVVELDTNGAVLTGFGINGAFTFDPGGQGNSYASAVAVRPSGRVVVAGSSQRSVTDTDFAVLQLNPAGALDGTFNQTGIALIDFGANAADFVNSNATGGGMALTPQGRVVVVGENLTTGGVEAARLIGTVEKGLRVAVGATNDGTASLFVPNFPTGQYAGTGGTPGGVFPGFAGVVRTAVADVNGDGFPDTILVTGPGTPVRFAVVSGKDDTTLLVPPTAPFAGSEGFTGGGFAAAGDLDNDGRAEIVLSPDQGGGPRVTIFSLNKDGSLATRANFFGIDDPNFRGGARPAVGDINGDGVADLAVAAGFLGGPRVAVFDGKTVFGASPTRLVNDFFAFPGTDAVTLRNGAFVAAGDVNGDGFADLVFGGGPGGAPRVFILSGQLVSAGNIDGAYAAPVANFFVAGNSSDRGGVRVASTDADGDNLAEVVVGSGEGSVETAVAYLGKNFTTTAEPATFQDFLHGEVPLAGGVFVG